MGLMIEAVPDPRDCNGPFAKLLEEIRMCKNRQTCPNLSSRGYYYEPNYETISKWKQEGLYKGFLDRRVIFVCESPGPQFTNEATSISRCWARTKQDKRFLKARTEYGLHDCYITNSVKCGVRKRSRHTEIEITSCLKYLLKEIELIEPMVAVAMGGNSHYVLRNHIMAQMEYPPIIFQMTHYSARGDVWSRWKNEFKELILLLARLKPQDQW